MENKLHEVYIEDGQQYRRIPGIDVWTNRVYGLSPIQSVDEQIKAIELEMQSLYRGFYQETVDMTEEHALQVFNRDYVDRLDSLENQIVLLEAEKRRGVA